MDSSQIKVQARAGFIIPQEAAEVVEKLMNSRNNLKDASKIQYKIQEKRMKYRVPTRDENNDRRPTEEKHTSKHGSALFPWIKRDTPAPPGRV